MYGICGEFCLNLCSILKTLTFYLKTNETNLGVECESSYGVNPFRKSIPSADYLIVNKDMFYSGNKYSNLFFNRTSKSLLFYFNGAWFDCKTQVTLCSPIPVFIEQMDVTLFSQLEGVIDFISKERKDSYLLLFRINGRPKFCTTLSEELSPEV